MREILFRGKRVDNGEWATSYNPNATMVCGVERVALDRKTVGQYIGLKDINGERIFEGDIVAYSGEYAEITYSETEAMFQAVFDDWYTDFDHLYGKEVEVVGNIHEAPTLLRN